MQTDNRLFDEIAKLLTTAAGAARGVREDVEGMIRLRLERLVADLDLVTREEFDAVKAMAQKARAESDALAARLYALEAAVSPPRQPKSARTRPVKPRRVRERSGPKR